MELDERKKTILNHVIKSYLETGEPVGSRTISKNADLNLSSATIRNEMADLEEMGYIYQPHTSSGRVPTDAGYRLYVDEVLKAKDDQMAEIQGIYLEKVDKLEKMLKQVVKVLADNTNYATMITAPKSSKNKIKFIQISAVDDHQLLVVVVGGGNTIRNKIVNIESELNNETLLKLNLLLNTNLNGIPLEQITFGMIARLKDMAGDYSQLMGNILNAIAETVKPEDLEIYTSGATNILNYPELSDKESARALLEVFEDKEELSELFNRDPESENGTGIQVYIGSETPVQRMKDCSVVTATYDLGDGMQGTVGIVGPKRMDYDNVVSTLKKLMEELDKVYRVD